LNNVRSYYRNKKRAGFTIIEIMITLAIFSIVMSSIHQLFVGGQRAWDNDLGMLDMQQSTRRGLHSITREIREASLASISMAVGCDNLSSPDNCNQITFNTPTKNSVLFFHNNVTKQIIRQDSSSGQRILASDIDQLYFCCAHGDGNCSCNGTYDIVEVKLQANKDSRGRSLDFSLRTKVKVRND